MSRTAGDRRSASTCAAVSRAPTALMIPSSWVTVPPTLRTARAAPAKSVAWTIRLREFASGGVAAGRGPGVNEAPTASVAAIQQMALFSLRMALFKLAPALSRRVEVAPH